MLSDCVGSHINGQVKNLVVPLTRKMERKEYRDRIFDVLRSLEENGVYFYVLKFNFRVLMPIRQ
jgi:hypothetical protein